jgi:hypothetical protein
VSRKNPLILEFFRAASGVDWQLDADLESFGGYREGEAVEPDGWRPILRPQVANTRHLP